MAAPARMTAQEYFAIDDASDIKHELVDGEIWAMAGASPAHARIAARVIRTVGNQLLGGSCDVYSSDLRVAVTYQTFAYPDATVVCGPLETLEENEITATNPTVVFEVLSPTTESYDRGLKLRLYSRLSSMKAIVLVSQDKPLVEVFERVGEDRWEWKDHEGLDATATIAALGVQIPLSELYEGISF